MTGTEYMAAAGERSMRGVVHYSVKYIGRSPATGRYQDTGSAFPSSYPAALWIPTSALAWKSSTLAAPA